MRNINIIKSYFILLFIILNILLSSEYYDDKLNGIQKIKYDGLESVTVMNSYFKKVNIIPSYVKSKLKNSDRERAEVYSKWKEFTYKSFKKLCEDNFKGNVVERETKSFYNLKCINVKTYKFKRINFDISTDFGSLFSKKCKSILGYNKGIKWNISWYWGSGLNYEYKCNYTYIMEGSDFNSNKKARIGKLKENLEKYKQMFSGSKIYNLFSKKCKKNMGSPYIYITEVPYNEGTYSGNSKAIVNYRCNLSKYGCLQGNEISFYKRGTGISTYRRGSCFYYDFAYNQNRIKNNFIFSPLQYSAAIIRYSRLEQKDFLKVKPRNNSEKLAFIKLSEEKSLQRLDKKKVSYYYSKYKNYKTRYIYSHYIKRTSNREYKEALKRILSEKYIKYYSTKSSQDLYEEQSNMFSESNKSPFEIKSIKSTIIKDELKKRRKK